MKKAVNYLICVLLAVIMITGCEKTSNKPQATETPVQKSLMQTFTIYSVNSDTMSVMPVAVKKEKKEITVAYVASLVENNINDDIQITSAKLEGNTAIVSFAAKGKPIHGCNKKMENMILECFANSLLDNVEGCKKIIFRCEDKSYKSKNNSFGVNEVYASE